MRTVQDSAHQDPRCFAQECPSDIPSNLLANLQQSICCVWGYEDTLTPYTSNSHWFPIMTLLRPLTNRLPASDQEAAWSVARHAFKTLWDARVTAYVP
jgi:hypothetical protein